MGELIFSEGKQPLVINREVMPGNFYRGQIELLPGYRAEPAKVSFSYIKPILSGTGLSWQKLKTWGGPVRVLGWTFGAGFGGTGLGPLGCWAGAVGWAN